MLDGLRGRSFSFSFKGQEAKLHGMQRVTELAGWGGGRIPEKRAQMVKNPPAMQETWVRSLDREDSPGGGNGNPLQYSCLESSVDRGAWGLLYFMRSQSRTRLSDQHFLLKKRYNCGFLSWPSLSPIRLNLQSIKTLVTNPVAALQMWELHGREMRHKSDEE